MDISYCREVVQSRNGANAMSLFSPGMSGKLDAYCATFFAALRAIILGFIVEGTT